MHGCQVKAFPLNERIRTGREARKKGTGLLSAEEKTGWELTTENEKRLIFLAVTQLHTIGKGYLQSHWSVSKYEADCGS